MRKDDFTPTGLRIEGPYENDRNAENAQLYKDIIREVFGVSDVIIAHHLVYVVEDRREGFAFQVVEEIPAVDTLIFDHDVAKKLWGTKWQTNLTTLALTPCAERDSVLATMYYGRGQCASANTMPNVQRTI